MKFFTILFYLILTAVLVGVVLLAMPKSCDHNDGSEGSDDGDIGVNVTTGKVKIDITDTEGLSIVGEVLDFDGGEDNTIRFYPGSLFHTEGFKVKNTGDIPVAFVMYVSREDSVDMDRFEEAFEFYVTTNLDDVENAEQLKSFSGTLEAGQSSETYYLVVKMKETAGNDFQDKVYNGIGITVNATQVNAEG